MDEGRLTDGRGRTVNFKNTIIILTSNLGSEFYRKSETNFSILQEKIMDLVKKYFKPEFVNRLDSIIVFNALNAEMVKKIVDIQLKDVEQRLKKQDLSFTVTEAMKKNLAVVGFDKVYGARPLRRIIDELIVDEIALQLIEGIIKPADKIIVDYKQNKINLSVKKPN